MAFRLLPNGIIECDTIDEAMQMSMHRRGGVSQAPQAQDHEDDSENQTQQTMQTRQGNGGQSGGQREGNDGTRHAGGDVLDRVLNRHKDPKAPRDVANQAGNMPMGRESQDEMTGTEDIIPQAAGGTRSARPAGNVEGRTTNPRGGDNPGTRSGAAESWARARKVAKKQGRTDIAKVRQELAAAKNG